MGRDRKTYQVHTAQVIGVLLLEGSLKGKSSDTEINF